MDLSPIIDEVLKPFWWLLPLMLLAGIFKTSWWKGLVGELAVCVAAGLGLDSDTYCRLHNVTLPTPDGTTQIDHVFVSRFGIFVLETKNLNGWIFGTENQSHWTQKIYKQSFKIQNPLRQNFKHVKAVEAALGVPADNIHSVVTFVGSSTFKTEMPRNVTKGVRFVSHIRSFRTPVFTESEVDALVERLRAKRLKPGSRAHREQVKRIKDRSRPSATRLCPRCGSSLVLRTAKAGSRAGQKFWGCSAFPRCRVVQSMT